MSAHESHEQFRYECHRCREEMDAAAQAARVGYRAEREMAQAMGLARQDLDMGLDVPEHELMAAIQRRFKR